MDKEEFHELRKFLWFHTEVLDPIGSNLPPNDRPLARLALLEKRSKAQAANGLKMAINDLLEKHRHDTPTTIMEIDAACNSRAVVPLSELHRRFSRDYSSILRSGSIRSEPQYYLVQGLLGDASSAISLRERTLLGEMVRVYELAAVQKARRKRH